MAGALMLNAPAALCDRSDVDVSPARLIQPTDLRILQPFPRAPTPIAWLIAPAPPRSLRHRSR